MRLKWLGHSAVLLTGTKRVMIDPFLTGNPVVRVEPEEREGLDYIAVTHDHRDHIGDAEALAKANGSPVVAVDDLAVSLQKRGVKGIGMNVGGRVGLNGVSFTMVQAVHSSSLGVPVGFIVEMDGIRVYHAGDTALFGGMSLIGERYRPTVLLLPIDGRYNMDIIDAVRAVELIKPSLAIPFHYNTWPSVAADPWEFKRLAEGISPVTVLSPGEEIVL